MIKEIFLYISKLYGIFINSVMASFALIEKLYSMFIIRVLFFDNQKADNGILPKLDTTTHYQITSVSIGNNT